MLSAQLPTALVGWNKAALYTVHGKERELLLLPAAVLGSTKGRALADWTEAGQYKQNKAHLKRCKWQWELEGFSVPFSPLGVEI